MSITIESKLMFPEDVNVWYESVNAICNNGFTMVKNSTVDDFKGTRYSLDMDVYKPILVETTDYGAVKIILEKTNDFDNEYLQRDLIEYCVYTITEEEVRISSPSTCFLHVYRTPCSIPSIETIQNNLKVLRKLCRENQIQLSGAKVVTDILKQNEVAFPIQMEELSTRYAEIQALAHQIAIRGIHVGLGGNGDVVLSYTQNKASAYGKYMQKESCLSKLIEINGTITNYIYEIQNGFSNYSRIKIA